MRKNGKWDRYLEGLEQEHRSDVRILNPGLSSQEEFKTGRKRVKEYLFFTGIGLAILGLAVLISFLVRSTTTTITSLQRGSEARSEELLVYGLNDEPVKISVPLSPAGLTAEEADALLADTEQKLSTLMIGRNDSADHITEDLYLPEKLGSVSLKWDCSDWRYLSENGVLLPVESVSEGPVELLLSVSMTVESRTGKAVFPITLYPAETAYSEDLLSRAFEERIKVLEQEKGAGNELTLPEIWNGKELSYEQTKRTDVPETLAFLAVIALAAAVYFRFRSQDQLKKRQESIDEDYSVIVMSLSGLMISGYTVRNAWHKLAEDYTASRAGMTEKQKQKSIRYAYEELVLADRKILFGASEIEAYREYAKLMGSRQYLRLSELLEQFVRTGRRDVYDLWNREHTQALEERKNRMSAKAAKTETGLALPMVLLLGMIMLMILVPTMMNF